MPTVTPLEEGLYTGDIIQYELDDYMSREQIVVLAGSGAVRTIATGTIIGARTASSVVATPDAGNTGDGSIGTVTVGIEALPGTYKLTCTAAATNSGTFQVVTPIGNSLPDVTVGTAYAGDHLNFTLSDGATDFIVGDSIDVVVSGDGKITALNLTAVDGTQNAYGIIYTGVTAPDGTDADGTAVVRDAVLADLNIVWPSGITTAQQTKAENQLKEKNITIREGVR